MDIDYDTYFEYHDQSYIIIEKVADYYGIELKDLRWDHYRDYAIDVEDIDVVSYRFGEVASKYLSGNIMNFFGNYGISYNPFMVEGRQRFSILHELGHYYFDMDKSKTTQSFSDLLDGNGYSVEDAPKEDRANIFASLALINNEALKDCFRNRMSFVQICEEFEISHAALYVRLYDFLTKLFMLNHSLARQAVNQYRYSGSIDKIYFYIKMGF